MTRLPLYDLTRNSMFSTAAGSFHSTRKALLTEERPDPVSEPATEHRIAIFARRDEQVSAIVEPRVNGPC